MNKRPIFDNDTAAGRALYREIVQRLDGLIVIQRLESQLKEAEAALHDVARGRYVRFADYIITHPEVKS